MTAIVPARAGPASPTPVSATDGPVELPRSRQRLRGSSRLRGLLRPRGRVRRLGLPALLVLATLTGLIVRFRSSGPLWLDEALTVDIAKLPFGELRGALKVDGSPPLYYYLLHVWMQVFGEGTHAVRAFSGVVSGLALIPLWLLARRLGGPALARGAVVLLATAPFSLRFGSETRMYSLVLLETCLGGLALHRAIERPTLRRLAPLTLAVLALAFTHYWTFFSLAAAALGLVLTRRWRVLGAFAVAAALFTPQLPTLLYQLRHTGTPWALPAMPRAVLDTLLAWGGPPGYGLAPLLGTLLLAIALLGALCRRDAGNRLILEPRANPLGLWLAGVSVGPLVLAVIVTMLAGAGFVERYTAIAVPGYVLLVALGLSRLRTGPGQLVVAAMAVVGLVTGTSDAVHIRTQAGDIAAAIEATTSRGDMVVYCPDQLAPAVHRVLPPGRVEVSYGDKLGPTRVDWVDYGQRNAGLDPVALARSYDARAGASHSISLVWAEGYRTLQGQCSALAAELAILRPGSTAWVGRNGAEGESSADVVFPGTAGLPASAFSVSSAPPPG